MKFCESLDRFVAIRAFTEAQKAELFKNVRITDKKSYMRLVINASVVNYIAEVAPLIFEKEKYALLSDIIEQELYSLCVKVNPGLDIKDITISIDSEDGAVHILGGESGTLDTGGDRFLDMEAELKRHIVGQDPAIKVISQAVRKAKVGLKSPEKPVGGFIFVGQTGVGKTALAKSLSHYLFGTKELIRVDCSEYAMSHEYAKLIGAPPGYIGHNDGGFLTEAIKSQPESVVVFDEIEKAHKKVHNLLLQILDEGRLTDSKGTIVSFHQAIIILTSNIGVDKLEKMSSAIGFGEAKEVVDEATTLRETRKALDKIFPPEFLNRIDEIILFNKLTRDDNIQIIDIMLRDVQERLKALDYSMSVDADAKDYLVTQGTNEKYGARPLRRAIQNYLENPLAELILKHQVEPGDKIQIGFDTKRKALSFYKTTHKQKKQRLYPELEDTKPSKSAASSGSAPKARGRKKKK
jgi:ATP-dependent Clp protease ATP-binding subunit ClpC